jgi:hypothetical protein
MRGASSSAAAPLGGEPALRHDARGEQQRRGADRDVEEEDVLPAGVAGEQAAGDQSDGRAAGSDGTPHAQCLVPLGALGEHVHHDRQRRREHNRRAEPLHAAHRDEEPLRGRQPAAQRRRAEHGQADHQYAAAPKQVRGTAAEQQETAEGERVAGDDPLQARFRHVQLDADSWQRHVDDREVRDRHEERDSQHRERAPAMNLSHALPPATDVDDAAVSRVRLYRSETHGKLTGGHARGWMCCRPVSFAAGPDLSQ